MSVRLALAEAAPTATLTSAAASISPIRPPCLPGPQPLPSDAGATAGGLGMAVGSRQVRWPGTTVYNKIHPGTQSQDHPKAANQNCAFVKRSVPQKNYRRQLPTGKPRHSRTHNF